MVLVSNQQEERRKRFEELLVDAVDYNEDEIRLQAQGDLGKYATVEQEYKQIVWMAVVDTLAEAEEYFNSSDTTCENRWVVDLDTGEEFNVYAHYTVRSQNTDNSNIV